MIAIAKTEMFIITSEEGYDGNDETNDVADSQRYFDPRRGNLQTLFINSV